MGAESLQPILRGDLPPCAIRGFEHLLRAGVGLALFHSLRPFMRTAASQQLGQRDGGSEMHKSGCRFPVASCRLNLHSFGGALEMGDGAGVNRKPATGNRQPETENRFYSIAPCGADAKWPRS